MRGWGPHCSTEQCAPQQPRVQSELPAFLPLQFYEGVCVQQCYSFPPCGGETGQGRHPDLEASGGSFQPGHRATLVIRVSWMSSGNWCPSGNVSTSSGPLMSIKAFIVCLCEPCTMCRVCHGVISLLSDTGHWRFLLFSWSVWLSPG